MFVTLINHFYSNTCNKYRANCLIFYLIWSLIRGDYFLIDSKLGYRKSPVFKKRWLQKILYITSGILDTFISSWTIKDFYKRWYIPCVLRHNRSWKEKNQSYRTTLVSRLSYVYAYEAEKNITSAVTAFLHSTNLAYCRSS